jgi:hypothetical protein
MPNTGDRGFISPSPTVRRTTTVSSTTYASGSVIRQWSILRSGLLVVTLLLHVLLIPTRSARHLRQQFSANLCTSKVTVSDSR